MSDLICRFAPSPTGHLHVGGARTALFNWALARNRRGRFLLRIEDTDRARSSEDAAQGILEDLAWLGIDWDEGPSYPPAGLGGDPRGVGPFFQSLRVDRYDACIRSLIEQDLAYPAFESEAELDALRKEARAEKRNFLYRRPADFDRSAALARMEREDHVIRFAMPDPAPKVVDEVLGEVEFGEEMIFDFIIRKRDGFPTYHLAVVADDEAMGVTHVLRGPEHLANTPRHVALQQALGFRVPVYATLPLILNEDGSKMSKRDKDKAVRAAIREALRSGADAESFDALVDSATLEGWLADKRRQLESGELLRLAERLELDLPGVDVEDFRRAGYLPGVLCNFLGLLGWSTGERDADGKDLEHFDLDYLAVHFGLERVGKGQARFDRAKLLAFNQQAIAALSDEGWNQLARAWAERYAPDLLERFDAQGFSDFSGALKTRCRTLADLASPTGPGAFVLCEAEEIVFDEKTVAKFLHKGDPTGLSLLRDARAFLSELGDFGPASIEAAVKQFCEARSVGMGKVAQPLRVAVTGSSASPPLGDTLALLGREQVLERIDRCLRECA